MWKVIRRAVLPVLLIAGSVASVIYGARHNTQVVLEEEEREILIGPPPEAFPPGLMPGMPPGAQPGMPGMPPGFPGPGGFPQPFLPPPQIKVIEKILVPTDTSEFTLTRELTFGGVVLLASGELKRTYSGKAPSLCPT